MKRLMNAMDLVDYRAAFDKLKMHPLLKAHSVAMNVLSDFVQNPSIAGEQKLRNAEAEFRGLLASQTVTNVQVFDRALSKDELDKQAQAGEPEVVAGYSNGLFFWKTPDGSKPLDGSSHEFITLQSHRDAMAGKFTPDWSELEACRASLREHMAAITKKDAALKAGVEALETCTPGDYSTGHVIHQSFDEALVDAAITQMQEAQQ